MAGGGATTSGGSFRFPYQFTDIIEDIKLKLEEMGMGDDWERLLSDFESLYMDRDRALEDYTTAAAGAIAFITVADDGTGDYDNIKEAIEAVPAGVSGDDIGPTVIYVKPSRDAAGYNETALGTITIAADTNIAVVSGLSQGGWMGDGGLYHRQAWISGQVTHTGSYSSLTVKGFLWQTTSTNTCIFTTASTIGGLLNLEDCTFVNPLYNLTTEDSYRNIIIDNCNITLHGGIANGTGFPTNFTVRNSVVALGSFSGGNFGCSAMSFGRLVDFENCRLSMAFGGCTFTGSFSDANGFGAIFSTVRVNSCVWGMTNSVGTFACTTVQAIFTNNTTNGGSNNGNNPGTFTFTNCGFGTTSDFGGREYGSTFLSNNNMEQGTLTVSATDNGPAAAYEQAGHPMMITGSWSKITLGINHCTLINYFGSMAGQAPTLTVTGHHNVIIGSFYQYWNGGRPAETPILCYGNNNYFIVKTGNYSGSYDDFGAGNIWNGAVNAMTMQIADAKGDLLVGWGNDDIRRLGVGANEQILEAMSTAVNGLGMQWVEPFKRRYSVKGDILIAAGDSDPQDLPVGQEARILRATPTAYVGVSWEYQRTLNNKLTQNQASLETDTAGWAAEAGCTIARSTAESSHGTASLEITKS